ncbi:Uncharacterized protein FWK35_00003861 [Aphis craccivora]|uniref:Uncharacterized protein n=1 Tax=Aphis craccivora TaxID=307492 RepID=A0A6G0Z202_APHCR|nr:Uncharacterized protein FWK35_00003861 [Aphis craccivora]
MKRIKIQCLSCDSIFDDDYKRKHEIRQHAGKKVLTKHFGAPENPFVAASAIARQNNTRVQIITDIVKTDCSSSSKHESVLLTPSILESNINICKITDDDNVTNKLVNVVHDDNKNTDSKNKCLDSLNDANSWLACAGMIEHLIHDFQECNLLLSKLKSDTSPNPISFLVNTSEIM